MIPEPDVTAAMAAVREWAEKPINPDDQNLVIYQAWEDPAVQQAIVRTAQEYALAVLEAVDATPNLVMQDSAIKAAIAELTEQLEAKHE